MPGITSFTDGYCNASLASQKHPNHVAQSEHFTATGGYSKSLAGMTTLPLTPNTALLPPACRDPPSYRPPSGEDFPSATRTQRSDALTPLATALSDCQVESAATLFSVSQKVNLVLRFLSKIIHLYWVYLATCLQQLELLGRFPPAPMAPPQCTAHPRSHSQAPCPVLVSWFWLKEN